MLKHVSTALFTLSLLLLVAGGCSKDNPTGPDTEAPVVSFLLPAPGDTVGITDAFIELQATDNIGITKIEIFIDGSTTPDTTISSPPWQATIAIADLADGPHTLTAKAYDEAGNIGTTNPLSFVKGIRSVDVVKRMALVEIVTSANCTPCGPANESYRQATSFMYYQERVATIKYHVPIPRPTDSLWIVSQSWARPRKDYLFGTKTQSAPNAWIDGRFAANTWQNWMAFVNEELAKPADAKITLSKTDAGNVVNLSITVKGLTEISHTHLRLHTVITESNIEYNDGNSEFIHYDVMRMMLPDANGEEITIAKGQEKTFSKEIQIDNTWKKENLEAVVFIQSAGSMYMLQAAKIPLH